MAEKIERPSPMEERTTSPAIVAPDRVKARLQGVTVSDECIRNLSGFRGSFDRHGEVYGLAAYDGNLYVRNGKDGVLIAGSLRVWADADGLVPFEHPFGPDEAGLVMDALDVRLGLPSGTFRKGRLTLLEFSADLCLARHPSRYVAACEDLSRTTPYRFGRETLYHHTEEWEVRLYDKPLQLEADDRQTPATMTGSHILRVECLLHRGGVPDKLGVFKDELGVVRAGLLADPAFRDELTRLWAAFARRLQFHRVPNASVVPTKASERVKLLAVRGIEASGGLSEALAEIEADVESGRLSPPAAKTQKRVLVTLASNPQYTTTSDLDAEFAAAVNAVATS